MNDENKEIEFMDSILEKNNNLCSDIFNNIFTENNLKFSDQLILSFNTFASAIECFADSIQLGGVKEWNFDKMMIGINRAYKLNKEQNERNDG